MAITRTPVEDAAMATVLERIKDIVFENGPWAEIFKCAHCGEMIYGLDDGDWLECVVSRAFDHECKNGKAGQ